MKSHISIALEKSERHKRSLNKLDFDDIGKLCAEALNTVKAGNKILIAGNGGSASDAQHIAAELVGRFRISRKALTCIALNTDTSVITALANDFGYEMIFSRQVEALARRGDLFLAISTSGNSENIVRACQAAQLNGCKVVLLSGRDGGRARSLSDVSVCIDSEYTDTIQELHIFVGHLVCEYVENYFKEAITSD